MSEVRPAGRQARAGRALAAAGRGAGAERAGPARPAQPRRPRGGRATGGCLQPHHVLHDQRRRRARRPASTSRSRGSGRCGTSRGHAGGPGGRRLRRVPGRRAGTWSRRRSTATARSGPACASCGSTPTTRSTWSRWPAAATTPGCAQMAVFDAVVNNADRKIGHLLPAPDGHLYGCDHGVCFGAEYKLRTVLWQWRGKRLPGNARRRAGAAGRASGPGRRPGRRAAQVAGSRTRWPPPGPGSAAARAQGAPVPAGRLAGGALAADLAGRPGQRADAPELGSARPGRRGGAGIARTRGRWRRRWPPAGRWRPWPPPGCARTPRPRSPARPARRRRAPRPWPRRAGRPAAARCPGCPRRRAAAPAWPSGSAAGPRSAARPPTARPPGCPRPSRPAGARRRCRSGPCSRPAPRAAGRPGPASEAAAVTGTGRVCGESASSAPSRITSSTPSSANAATSSAAEAAPAHVRLDAVHQDQVAAQARRAGRGQPGGRPDQPLGLARRSPP